MSYQPKGTLARTDEEKFKLYLLASGFEIKDPDSSMVIKAFHKQKKEWMIVYDGKSPFHFTVQSNMRKRVRDFIHWKAEHGV